MKYKNLTIEEIEIQDVPMFYKNISGGTPYVTRTDGSIDVGKNIFKVIETVDLDAVIVSGESSTSVTHSHNLGYRPLCIGSYVMKNATVSAGLEFPNPYRGMIPEAKLALYGAAIDASAYISDVDENTIQAVVNHGADGGTISFRLHILREPTSSEYV